MLCLAGALVSMILGVGWIHYSVSRDIMCASYTAEMLMQILWVGSIGYDWRYRQEGVILSKAAWKAERALHIIGAIRLTGQQATDEYHLKSIVYIILCIVSGEKVHSPGL